MSKKSFLICPVRGVSMADTEVIVERLEEDGYEVHWPPRDTDQEDHSGYRICKDNRQAIAEADVIHFVWDGKSQGCLFDLGIAFALYKSVIPIQMPSQTIGKSFQNMVADWFLKGAPM